MSRPEQLQNTSRLWEEHVRAVFPARSRGAEPADIDMVLLDASIAGCVSTWLNNGGTLDPERSRILQGSINDLDRVLLGITEAQELRYFQRLRQLAMLVSAASLRAD
ncbi:hypothetical protein [Streptomyces griseochromogenes]|uniref:hypothetical protein n=1 Tax=Streptomyces griseochromogenes TaxID=68214 RepID=UPI001F207A81|nr:hypothetical protein [Streptomyces griseochromogenes]